MNWSVGTALYCSFLSSRIAAVIVWILNVSKTHVLKVWLSDERLYREWLGHKDSKFASGSAYHWRNHNLMASSGGDGNRRWGPLKAVNHGDTTVGTTSDLLLIAVLLSLFYFPGCHDVRRFLLPKLWPACFCLATSLKAIHTADHWLKLLKLWTQILLLSYFSMYLVTVLVQVDFSFDWLGNPVED